MIWETPQTPWDVVQAAQLIRLASKLNTTEPNGEQGKGYRCLARALAKVKLDPEQVDWTSTNKHPRQATQLPCQWGGSMAMPLTKGGDVSQKWKKGLGTRLAAKAREVAWEAPVNFLAPRAPALARGGDQADKGYVQGGNIDMCMSNGASSPPGAPVGPEPEGQGWGAPHTARAHRRAQALSRCGHPGVAVPT